MRCFGAVRVRSRYRSTNFVAFDVDRPLHAAGPERFTNASAPPNCAHGSATAWPPRRPVAAAPPAGPGTGFAWTSLLRRRRLELAAGFACAMLYEVGMFGFNADLHHADTATPAIPSWLGTCAMSIDTVFHFLVGGAGVDPGAATYG